VSPSHVKGSEKMAKYIRQEVAMDDSKIYSMTVRMRKFCLVSKAEMVAEFLDGGIPRLVMHLGILQGNLRNILRPFLCA